MRILLVAIDYDSHLPGPPLGLMYIASAIINAGHDVEVYNQDLKHYPDEHLTGYLDSNEVDAVGVSLIAGYYEYKKIKKLSAAINRSKKRPFYIIGGHGPSPEPEFFIKKTKADAIVIGEGEVTIVNLLEALENSNKLENVKGIAFRDGEKVVINERQPLIEDIDSIPLPAYHIFPVDYYRLRRAPHCANSQFSMWMLSGRGCPFRCSFCYRMDEGFRPRSNEGIIEEILLLKRDYGVTYFTFQDELLMSSQERIIDVCEAFIKANLKVKWNCNGRLNFAKPHVLKLMKKAGCVFINYGIEAMDDVVLKKMNKRLTTNQIIRGIETTIQLGISPGINILFGNIGDDKETLDKAVKFFLKYDEGVELRTIRPVTPYPGSQLYYDSTKMGLIKDCEDFYENKHKNSDLITVNFTNMSDEEFYNCLYKANNTIIKNNFQIKLSGLLDQTKRLYLNQDDSFRGFRHTSRSVI